MTKSEQRSMQRLEIENEELRKMNSQHIDVYRAHIEELIMLRTRDQYIHELLNEALKA